MSIWDFESVQGDRFAVSDHSGRVRHVSRRRDRAEAEARRLAAAEGYAFLTLPDGGGVEFAAIWGARPWVLSAGVRS